MSGTVYADQAVRILSARTNERSRARTTRARSRTRTRTERQVIPTRQIVVAGTYLLKGTEVPAADRRA